jgi:hypothetical protein
MNATRRLAKPGVIKYAYSRAQSTITSNIIQSLIILVLIAYSAVLIKYVSYDFLSFFENIFAKIIVLIIIAFVGLYSPAVALFIAIALITTLQMAQKRKLSFDIKNMAQLPQIPKQEVMQKLDVLKSKMTAGTPKIMESIDGSDGYLDPEFMQENYQDDEQDDDQESQEDFAEETQHQQASSEYLPMKQSRESSDSPMGYNENASCLSCGDGGNSSTALNSQCGYVQTWENQFSAQGLGQPITGFQNSVGYPFV